MRKRGREREKERERERERRREYHTEISIKAIHLKTTSIPFWN